MSPIELRHEDGVSIPPERTLKFKMTAADLFANLFLVECQHPDFNWAISPDQCFRCSYKKNHMTLPSTLVIIQEWQSIWNAVQDFLKANET